MQVNILWSGREYYSLENCLVNTTDIGSQINSVIVGKYGDSIYRVTYQIKTNDQWEATFFEITSHHDSIKQHFKFEGDGKGNWTTNSKNAGLFKGCIDIDIPLTPFTNTLPIKRLNMLNDTADEIKVIYVDLLEQQITPVRQKYLRLSKTLYHYENIPNDFEANIEVDEHGFVVDYPSLFVRTALLHTSYET